MTTIQRPKPPFAQLADALRAEILDGTRGPGQAIHTERDIAEEFGVSLANAKMAAMSLKSQGLVGLEAGVATVRDLGEPITLTPRERHSYAKSTGRIRLRGEESHIEADVVDAPDDVRESLNLEAGQQAIRRQRVTSNRGTVVEVSRSWFDAAIEGLCPDLREPGTIRPGTTAYVADRLGVDVRHSIERVTPTLAEANDVEHFGLQTPAAILVITLTLYDHRGKPLAYETYRQPPSQPARYEYEL